MPCDSCCNRCSSQRKKVKLNLQSGTHYW